jgi:hypothetical protein
MFEPERRDLSWVPRWGIVRCNRRQSVADHSYFVTCYGLKIAEMIGWPDVGDGPDYHGGLDFQMKYDLAVYLLRHDEDEAVSGDIPGPIKRMGGFDCTKLDSILLDRFGPPPTVHPGTKEIKKAADLVDECMYLAGEINSGNSAAWSSYKNATKRLSEALDGLPATRGQRLALFNVLTNALHNQLNYEKDYKGFAGI